jgi:hypothetical protein
MSRVLSDHPEVFTDQVHTDERGARHVADALYERLLPTIQRAER